MEAVKVNISVTAHCRKRKNRKGRKSGMTFLAALFQMLALLIMVGAGFYMAKRGMLDEHTNTHMSAMLVNVFNPMLIISSAVSAAGQVSKASLLLVGGIAVGMFVLFIVVGMVIMPFFDRNPEQRKMFQSMFVFSNVGFIGIPVVSSILGPEYVVYVTEFMLVYSVIFYTYGVALLEGKFSSQSLKSMVNPGTVCSIAAFFIVAFDIGLPGFLKTAVTYLGNVTSPMALVAVGFSLAHSDLKEIFSQPRLYLFSAVKLLLLPLILLPALRLAVGGTDLLPLCVTMFGMPAGNLPMIYAAEKGIDCTVCGALIIMTTVLCVFTIPLLLAVL